MKVVKIHATAKTKRQCFFNALQIAAFYCPFCETEMDDDDGDYAMLSIQETSKIPNLDFNKWKSYREESNKIRQEHFSDSEYKAIKKRAGYYTLDVIACGGDEYEAILYAIKLSADALQNSRGWDMMYEFVHSGHPFHQYNGAIAILDKDFWSDSRVEEYAYYGRQKGDFIKSVIDQ